METALILKHQTVARDINTVESIRCGCSRGTSSGRKRRSSSRCSWSCGSDIACLVEVGDEHRVGSFLVQESVTSEGPIRRYSYTHGLDKWLPYDCTPMIASGPSYRLARPSPLQRRRSSALAGCGIERNSIRSWSTWAAIDPWNLNCFVPHAGGCDTNKCAFSFSYPKLAIHSLPSFTVTRVLLRPGFGVLVLPFLFPALAARATFVHARAACADFENMDGSLFTRHGKKLSVVIETVFAHSVQNIVGQAGQYNSLQGRQEKMLPWSQCSDAPHVVNNRAVCASAHLLEPMTCLCVEHSNQRSLESRASARENHHTENYRNNQAKAHTLSDAVANLVPVWLKARAASSESCAWIIVLLFILYNCQRCENVKTAHNLGQGSVPTRFEDIPLLGLDPWWFPGKQGPCGWN